MADGRRLARLGLIASLLMVAWHESPKAEPAANSVKGSAMASIWVIVGDAVLPATLDDNSAAHDFASLLPLDLTLSNFHGIEKVADLGRKLDAKDAPDGYAPSAGDITQYAPWSNLAIFYKPFQYSRSLVRLGEFEGPIDPLLAPDGTTVRIELAD